MISNSGNIHNEVTMRIEEECNECVKWILNFGSYLWQEKVNNGKKKNKKRCRYNTSSIYDVEHVQITCCRLWTCSIRWYDATKPTIQISHPQWIWVNTWKSLSHCFAYITHTHTHRRQCPTIQCCHLCSGICPFPHYLGNSVIMMRESQWMKATLTRSQSSKWNMVCLYVWASEAILSFVFFFDNSCSLWTSEHSRSKLLNWCFTAMIGWPWLSIYFPRDSMSIFFIYDPIGWCTEEKTY